MPPAKTGKNPRASKGAKNAPADKIEEPLQCHIREGAYGWGLGTIPERVCVNDLPLTEHSDGKHYCLFHLPTQDKDVAKFEAIFQARLDAVSRKAAEIEELPEDERENAKHEHFYDFRYVWFPSAVDLVRYKFQSFANFTEAVFSASANFYRANFSNNTSFERARFAARAYFSKAEFPDAANFGSATFSDEAEFIMTSFSSYAEFTEASFAAGASFTGASFAAGAEFDRARFAARAYFYSASFLTGANFREASFSANAEFRKASFLTGANFREASFSSVVNFDSARFLAESKFDLANFAALANFREASFLTVASFTSASFSSDAYFNSTGFGDETNFNSASFAADADFNSAIFSGDADFTRVKFEDTSQIFFYRTSFQGVARFRQAVIKGYLYFEAGEGKFFDGEWLDDEKTQPRLEERWTSVFEKRLNFAHVRIEKPERITFNKVRLCPGWFVNSDSRKFVFTDIAWENHRAGRLELKRELISLTRRGYKKPHNYQLLTIAFRNLAANAEEFNRFEEASNFRKSASECEKLERIYWQKKWWREFKAEKGNSLPEWWRQIKEARFDFVHLLYRWLSYYGESWSRAFFWLWVIWIAFALGFYLLGDFVTEQSRESLGFGKSFAYSLFVMTLQKPEPRPFSTVTYLLYGLETIFAPVQAALLALAIRRKFMR